MRGSSSNRARGLNLTEPIFGTWHPLGDSPPCGSSIWWGTRVRPRKSVGRDRDRDADRRAGESFQVYIQRYRFRKLVHAPLPYVFAWCTDYREDDDRITDSIYHYRANIVLREPARVVRVITVPGRNRNRCTDVEIISLRPPDRWRLTKLSVTDDVTGSYRLTRQRGASTSIEMRFRRVWKVGRPPDLKRYRALFNRVWDRYVAAIEAEYRRHPG
jgi:hypothetical protein